MHQIFILFQFWNIGFLCNFNWLQLVNVNSIRFFLSCFNQSRCVGLKLQMNFLRKLRERHLKKKIHDKLIVCRCTMGLLRELSEYIIPAYGIFNDIARQQKHLRLPAVDTNYNFCSAWAHYLMLLAPVFLATIKYFNFSSIGTTYDRIIFLLSNS